MEAKDKTEARDRFGNTIRTGDCLLWTDGSGGIVSSEDHLRGIAMVMENGIRPPLITNRDGLPFDSAAEAAKGKARGVARYGSGEEVRAGDWYASGPSGLPLQVVRVEGDCSYHANGRDSGGSLSLDIPNGRAYLVRRGVVGEPFESISTTATPGARVVKSEVVPFTMSSGSLAGNVVIENWRLDQVEKSKPEPLTLAAFDKIVREVVAAEAPRAKVVTDRRSRRENPDLLIAWLELKGIKTDIEVSVDEEPGPVEGRVRRCVSGLLLQLGRRESGR